MTHTNDIIRMAREAGLSNDFGRFGYPFLPELERFAALVLANHPPQSSMAWQEGYEAGAAAERNKVAAWMMNKGYATGHGDTVEDLLKELEWQVRESEREACALVCETKLGPTATDFYGKAYAAAIRARGQA